MKKIFQKYWLIACTLIFVIANSWFIANEFYYLSFAPLLLAIVFLAFFNVKALMWIIIFATPLSLNLEELAIGGIGMYLPTEPLLFGVMLLFFLKLIISKQSNKELYRHPVSYGIYLYFLWLIITTLTSELPVVSLKFVISRLWFVVGFYFVLTTIFKNPKNIRTFLSLYIAGMTIVIIYTLIRHYLWGFGEKPAHWVMSPFFKDHTSYGAALAFFFPPLFLYLNKKRQPLGKLLGYLLFGLFTIATIFSYTRAAWVSLAGAFVLFIIYYYKVHFKYLMFLGVIGLAIIAWNWNNVFDNLEKNNQDSSTHLTEHVQSISNVSTDASNLERLNRWYCALRMFAERPVFGFGPGTYVFQYAPFQRAKERTIISTNTGDNGNAHSEYIGPLAEAGILGMGTFVLLLIIVYYRGSTLYHGLPKGELKNLVLILLLGLFTYVLHGMLNNYLDTDKISAPFWGFIAAIVAIDINWRRGSDPVK